MFARGRFCGFFDEVDEGGGRRRHVSSDSHRGPSGNRAVTHAPKQDIVSDGLLDTPGSRPGPLTPTLRLAMTPRV